MLANEPSISSVPLFSTMPVFALRRMKCTIALPLPFTENVAEM